MYCSKCGKQLGDSYMYCDSCGTPTARNKIIMRPTENIQTIYFKDGQLFRVVGKDEQNWYDADMLVSDGKTYDLRAAGNIWSIHVPSFGVIDVMDGYGTTGMLDYVLRMKAGNCFNRNEKELCSALLWKSTQLMFANTFCGWQQDDFKRLIEWHLQMDMMGEAKKARTYLESKGVSFVSPLQFFDNNKITSDRSTAHSKENYTKYEREYIDKAIDSQNQFFDSTALSIKESVMESAIQFNMDLVAFHDYGSGCCEDCAKKTGRVYSLSGSSKRFLALPKYVKDHGNFHPGCRCTMSLYFEGDEIYYKGDLVNALKASNRPWTDDRDQREIDCYLEYIDRTTSKAKNDALKDWDRYEYNIIVKEFPDVAPKSFNSYRRMKGQNTSGFQKLKSQVIKIGIDI